MPIPVRAWRAFCLAPDGAAFDLAPAVDGDEGIYIYVHGYKVVFENPCLVATTDEVFFIDVREAGGSDLDKRHGYF